jgi:hypothetical protein
MTSYKRFGRGLGSLFVSSSSRNSKRLSKQMARVARHGDMPDAGIYERPNTTRISTANLWLSIIVVGGIGLLLALAFFHFVL